MRGLAFSGGKDSWACLWLEPDLSKTVVLWVNTGKCYPEQIEMIELAKKMCPNFIEIKTDQAAQNAREGLPADVVPVNWTVLGQLTTGKKDVTVQSYLGCCWQNISGPLQDKIKELGITHIVRGQRNDESHKGTSRHGATIDGITYIHPIENWTRKQVLDFLAIKMDIPEHFSINHSSLDCYDCTGYAAESKDRIEFTKAKYPVFYDEYMVRKTQLQKALSEAMQ